MTENKKRTRLFHSIVVMVCFVSFLGGCATGKKRTESTPGITSTETPPLPTVGAAEKLGPPEPYGPPQPDTPPSYGPDPVQAKPITLIFGPGIARGYAYVGVLRALKEAKIPIAAIYGTEMGGLIGALFAMSKNLNQFEWGMLKFKEDVFLEKRGFFSLKSKKANSSLSDGHLFDKQLKEVFNRKDIKDATIPIKIVLEEKETGTPIILDHGEATKILKAAMTGPRVFQDSNLIEGKQTVSSAKNGPYLITHARTNSSGPVIVVTVDSFEVLPEDLKQADLIVHPDMNGIDELDFQKRTDAAFRGQSALVENLPQIYKLVGLPEGRSNARSAKP